MAEQWQWRRGTGIENDAFIGAEGEITVDLTNHELRVHTGDGKEGGYKLGRTTDRTNCITEIPQDIQLELTNGTLTLKAGSKVYVPNGINVFNEVVIENDIVISTGTSVTSCFLFYNNSNSLLNIVAESSCYSGDTEPITTPYVWYNIANNIITRNTGSSTFNYSLPLAKITCNSSSQIVSIDQVFNGFGYIGSTVFTLPGVKGLIPNGRNADGTLKNTAFEISSVKTMTSGVTANYTIALNSSGILLDSFASYSEQENYNSGNSRNYAFVGSLTNTSGVISNFNIKTTFHAVDYSEADFVVSFQRPTVENNYTWYRLYKSGWVEQGGYKIHSSNENNGSVTFPVEMSDTNYVVSLTKSVDSNFDVSVYAPHTRVLSTTGFTYAVNADIANSRLFWTVSGMAA